MVNLKEAGQYLESLNIPSAEVFAFPQKASSGSTVPAIALLDYYSDVKITSEQNWSVRPEEGNMNLSSLRFTWEMKKPRFYAKPPGGSTRVLVVISDESRMSKPSGFRELKRFARAENVFKYQTVVTIYAKD